jgi:hypothetical protein
MAALNEMAEREIHRIVVLGGDNRLARIATPMDVFRSPARGERFELLD